MATSNSTECAPCREETCCPVSPFTHKADAEDTTNQTECPTALVNISPEDGSAVMFPTFVTLSHDTDGAVIRYTLDGSEPDEDSQLYSVPFTVLSSAITVKAKAFKECCDASDTKTANYVEAESWLFSYLCDTEDRGGGFNEFSPNGYQDYQFKLNFTLDALTEIVSIEVYQTDETGFWNSGQSWATQEWLYPFPNPSIPFHTYPLVIIDPSGPTQLFSEYKTTLGSYAAGAYEWRLFGQPATPLNGYFLCKITLGDGTVIRRLISTECDASEACSTQTAFVTGMTPGTLMQLGAEQNNNFQGLAFQVGASNITITHLGRWNIPGNSQVHTIIIRNPSDGDALIASAEIDCGTEIAGDFVYAALPVPVVLEAGGIYSLLSEEWTLGDFWYNSDTVLTTTAVASVLSARDETEPSGGPNNSFGPVSFKYCTP